MLCSANNVKIRAGILTNTLQGQSEKYSKMILVACMQPKSESHRASTLLESQHKKHTEKVTIFTLEEAEELDFFQFLIISENLTFKAQMCHLRLNLKRWFLSWIYNIIRTSQCPVPDSLPRVSVDPEQLQIFGSHSLPPRLAEDMRPVPRIHLGYMVTLAPKYGPS